MATVKMMPFIVQPFILLLLALPLLRKKRFPILKTHTCVQSHQELAFLTSSLQHPPNLRTPPPSPSPFQVYDFFLFYNPMSPIIIAHMCMVVGPSTTAWATRQEKLKKESDPPSFSSL